MCGIIGYIGARQACPIIFDGLARLEYRGYDSAGIVVASEGVFAHEKQSGKLRELESLLKTADIRGTAGLGHTRWATHGPPTRTNAHPHFSMDGKLALVHNGIIENHDELRRKLRKKGYRFISETDSEVLCQLIASHFKNDLRIAVATALKEVEGGFAIGVMHADKPDELVAARVDNPLIIGVGKGENFIASDIPAILPYTRKVIYLSDGEIAVVRRDSVELRTFAGRKVKPVIKKVDWDVAGAEKGGYPHFMLKEIHEQAKALADTIKGRISPENDKVIFRHLGLTVKQLRAIKRVQFVACGTAYHAALVGRQAVEELAGIPAVATPASEFRYGDPVLGEDTLAIGVSQSGETIDTLVALRTAKEKGARVISVCNVIGSSIPRMADGVLYTRAGPEIGVASTKAYTTQLIALTLFAIKLGLANGRLKKARARELLSEIRRIPDKARKVVANDKLPRLCAESYKYVYDFLYIGRRYNYPTAIEGALKLKELSYIHGEGYPAGEMKHGPIALVEDSFPTVAIAVKGRVYDKILSNIQEVKARGGIIISIATQGDRKIKALSDFVISIPATEEMLSPILAIIPLQILAYYIAVHRGCDVDQPRNLAKSVTVE